MALNREVETTFSYLTSLSIRVSREWLAGCVEYFKAENPQYTSRDVQEFVKQQWELSDLRDSSDGCLPPNLRSQMKITLRGKYSLQVESVVNIAESAYSQLQKVKKVDVVNVEATERKDETLYTGRMLKLMLFDGQQEVQGIEYRSLPAVNEHILPGTKVLIIGPVDCRKGVFFLKPQNIKVLGGEVDTLLKTNHYENILARSLGLPENPDPFSNEISTTVSSSSLTTTQGSVYTPSIVSSTVHNNRTVNPRHTVTSSTTRTTQQSYTSSAVRNTSQPQAANAVENLEGTGWTVDDLLADGDDIFQDIPEEISMATEEPVSTSITRGITAIAVPFTNMVAEKRANIFLPSSSKSLPKTSWLSVPDKPTPKPPQSSTTKSNPFLASDDYLASIDFDEWENDLDDAISVPPNPECDATRSTENTSLRQGFKQTLREPQNPGDSNQDIVLKTKHCNNPTTVNPLSSSLVTTKITSIPVNPFPVKKPSIMQKLPRSNSPSLGTTKYSSSPHVSFVKSSSVQLSTPVNPLHTALDITKMSATTAISPSVFGGTKTPPISMNSQSVLNSAEHLSASSFANKSVSKTTSSYSTSSTTVQAKQKSDAPADRHSFLESRSHLCPSVSSPSDWTAEPSCKRASSDVDDSRTTTSSRITTSSVSKIWALNCDTVLPSKNSVSGADAWSPLKNKVPFVYLGHILQSDANKPSGTHRVKATIMSLLSHLKVDSSEEWNLSATICDGTATLDVEFASEVLDELIGLSAHEFKKMKRDLPRNPLLKNQLVKILKTSQQKLIDLNCFFDVKFDAGKMAQVIKLSEITKQNVQDLRSRMNDI